MLGKLIKYDFKKTAPVMGLLCGITILLGIVCSILQHWSQDTEYGLIELLGLMALFVIAPLHMISKYYCKSLYTNEAYLTFTLPAKNKVIVSSKIIVTLIWATIFCASAFISLMALSPESIVHVFKEGIDPKALLTIIYLLFVMFFMGMAGVMALIFSVCIGNLWRNHNTIGTILCFTVLGFTLMFVYLKNLGMSVAHRGDCFWGEEDLFCIQNLVCSIVFIAIFFVATVHITSKKLNLD